WTLLVVLMLAVVPAGAAEGDKSAEGPVYELRIYTAAEGKLDALNERFRSHTARLFKRHGIENVGYWVAADAPKSETTLIYLLQHASREAADKSWQAFRNDPEWQKVAAESKARDGDLLAAKVDATYLVGTDYAPKLTSHAADQLPQPRVAGGAPGKLHTE